MVKIISLSHYFNALWTLIITYMEVIHSDHTSNCFPFILALSISVLAVKRVLNTLEILDRYNFNRADSNSSIDSLYSKIFADSTKAGGQVTA